LEERDKQRDNGVFENQILSKKRWPFIISLKKGQRAFSENAGQRPESKAQRQKIALKGKGIYFYLPKNPHHPIKQSPNHHIHLPIFHAHQKIFYSASRLNVYLCQKLNVGL
jgi:hypothetical protein